MSKHAIQHKKKNKKNIKKQKQKLKKNINKEGKSLALAFQSKMDVKK